MNGIEYYDHVAIPEWENSILLSVLGGLGGQYERLSVLHLSEDGLNVESEDQYFSSFNQRIRDVAVNPYTGSVYVAFNGTSYPGSGPNIIKEFRNESFASSVDQGPELLEAVAFPNPANDIIQFQWKGDFGPLTYDVFAFNGQKMISGRSNGGLMSCATSDWPVGAYFIVIQHSQGNLTTTFQVQH